MARIYYIQGPRQATQQQKLNVLFRELRKHGFVARQRVSGVKEPNAKFVITTSAGRNMNKPIRLFFGCTTSEFPYHSYLEDSDRQLLFDLMVKHGFEYRVIDETHVEVFAP